MTELHYALVAAAVLLLLLLFGWSRWQQRRARRGRDAGDAQQPALSTGAAESGRIEPRLGGAGDAAPAGEAAAEAAHPRPQLAHWAEDPMLDCVLELRCAHGADGVAVIDAVAPLLRLDCGLPVHVAAWDARLEQWVLPDRFGFYAELLASIQLANRGQKLGDIEASRFIAAVEQVALALDADFDPPELPLLRRRAEQLEALVAQFDVQIGVTVQANDGALNPARVHKAAPAVGLSAAGDNAWSRADDAGHTLFSARLTAEHRLVLELDVPLVEPSARPLQTMFAAAAELAVLLEGRVVDDRGRPITPGSVEAIDGPLQALYEKMRGADLEPGGERARRLFA